MDAHATAFLAGASGRLGGLQPTGEGYPLTMFQRVLLESRGRRIARGTNQIQRNIIAERVLGLPK